MEAFKEFDTSKLDKDGFNKNLKMTGFMCAEQGIKWEPISKDKKYECQKCGIITTVSCIKHNTIGDILKNNLPPRTKIFSCDKCWMKFT